MAEPRKVRELCRPMSHYDTLGVAPTATESEITEAYRELVKVVHPDRGGDAIMFSILTESYDLLSDPERRAAYDAALAAQHEPSGASTSAQPAEPLSAFDQIALSSYRRRLEKQGETGTESTVSSLLKYFLVFRFAALPLFISGGVVALIPFWPIRVLGFAIMIAGVGLMPFVAHGARTTRRKREAAQRVRPKQP